MRNTTARLLLVWAVILVIVAGTVVLQNLRAAPDPEGMNAAGPSADESASVGPPSMEAELIGKLLVGAKQLSPVSDSQLLLANAKPLEEGGPAERLSHAILVGSLGDWDRGAALARGVEIEAAENGGAPQEAAHRQAEQALRDDVVSALESVSAANGDLGAVSAETQERIESSLGFFGRLLREGGGGSEALRALGVILAAGLWYCGAFMLGLVALIVLGYRLLAGSSVPRLEPADDMHCAIVLGETFAIWLALFLLLTVSAQGASLMLAESIGTAGGLLFSLLAMGGSLAVLGYPSSRGVAFADLRRLLGLHAGRGVVAEIGSGVACYISAVPILAVGFVIFAILSAIAALIAGEQAPPSHPAIEMLSAAGPLEVVLLFALASVMAPIVEEIAFRGVLYGHLRGVVAPRTRFLSAAVAAIGSSFIFAAIHPQGLMFVPALGGLAVGFCIYRETRGSLIAPMVAHGINNAFTLSLGMLLFGG